LSQFILSSGLKSAKLAGGSSTWKVGLGPGIVLEVVVVSEVVVVPEAAVVPEAGVVDMMKSDLPEQWEKEDD
jgi:hypothetical protein